MSEEKNTEKSDKAQGASDKPAEKAGPIATGLKKEKNEQLETKQETSNQQPATENMEVHKHPHHVTHKKKWGEYFLEFFMIFLAITLGFIAENIREHSVEKTNAKRYMETYRDELLQQKNLFAEYKKRFQTKIINSDTIKMIFFNHEENQKLDVLQRLVIPVISLIDVPFNTSSYDQMVNSGALRYINDIELRDSMSAYKGQIEITRAYNTRILQSLVNVTFEVSKLQDFHDVISTDTSQSYDLTKHIPDIKPFETLTEQERRSLIFFYESYIIQAQSDLRRLRNLEAANHNLVNMVNEQLK